MIDIRSTRYKIIPIYNFEGQTKALFCKEHIEDGMVNIITKRCKHEKCKTIPNYNFDSKKKHYFAKIIRKME